VLPRTAAAGRAELAPLALLPREGRLPNSDGYSHPPLGEIEGLPEVFYASYQEPGSQEAYRLFVAVARDEGAAAGRYAQVKASFEKERMKLSESSEGSARVLSAEGDSTSFVVLRGRHLAGGIDLPKPELLAPAKARLLKALEGPPRPQKAEMTP